MPPSVTPLNARSQSLISVLLAAVAILGLSPFAEVFATRWPLRFGELLWRYDIFGTLLLNTPQLVVLTCIMAIACVMTGNRAGVRATAFVFGLLAALQLLVLPFFALDYFQVRRVIAASRTPGIKALMIKTLLFALLSIVAAAWAAYAAWQASDREGAGLRRQKGEGLVVGQPKEPRPPV